MHRVRVTGLQPATAYGLVVRANGAVVGDGRFVTAPRPDAGAPLTFLVYGDDRSDDAAHASVVRAMAAAPSDFLVNTGDMVADGASAANWQTFFDIEKPLLHERALFPAIGNHELYDDAAGTNFARYFGFPDESGVMRPYGTVRFGSARFFFLNGMDDWASGAERQWLERALSRGRRRGRARVALRRRPPRAHGPPGRTGRTRSSSRRGCRSSSRRTRSISSSPVTITSTSAATRGSSSTSCPAAAARRSIATCTTRPRPARSSRLITSSR